jgi:hypothetical protein
MPEVLDPIAPPTAAPAPLAPPTVATPASTPVAQVVVEPSPTQREDDALANRDVKQLTNIAKDNIGTPAAEVALGAAVGGAIGSNTSGIFFLYPIRNI